MEETRITPHSVADKSELSAVTTCALDELTFIAGGKSVLVKVVDRCEGCAYYDLDFSPSAFDQLASESEGRYIFSCHFSS